VIIHGQCEIARLPPKRFRERVKILSQRAPPDSERVAERSTALRKPGPPTARDIVLGPRQSAVCDAIQIRGGLGVNLLQFVGFD